jgi:hypothetical protein
MVEKRHTEERIRRHLRRSRHDARLRRGPAHKKVGAVWFRRSWIYLLSSDNPRSPLKKTGGTRLLSLPTVDGWQGGICRAAAASTLQLHKLIQLSPPG